MFFVGIGPLPDITALEKAIENSKISEISSRSGLLTEFMVLVERSSGMRKELEVLKEKRCFFEGGLSKVCLSFVSIIIL